MTDVVADAYATMAEFRTFLRVTATTDATDADTGLELIALEAASKAIDVACNRNFRPAAAQVSARYFTSTATPSPVTYAIPALPGAAWLRHSVLHIDDVCDDTGITVAFDASGDGDFTTAVTAYRLGPLNAPSRGEPWSKIIFNTGTYPPALEDGVRVEALWGWTAIPSIVTNACLIQAARFLKRRDAAFGIAGSPDMGSELRLLARLDPDVALMVASLRRNWGAA